MSEAQSRSPADHLVTGSITPEDVAAVEFYLRCRISNPLKSWYKATEIAEPCGFNRAVEAGQAIASIAADPDSGLDVEKRSGYRRSAWHVTPRDGESDV